MRINVTGMALKDVMKLIEELGIQGYTASIKTMGRKTTIIAEKKEDLTRPLTEQ